MRTLTWFAAILLTAATGVFAQDIDVENLARPERLELANCMSDTLTVIEKYGLGRQLFSLWDIFDASCAIEIERVKSAAENQLKDDFEKKLMPGQLILAMVTAAAELYEKKPLSSCSGTGCAINEYRTCLMRQMPTAIRLRTGPRDFDNQAQQQCEDTESAARSALTNDFDNVQKRHRAGRFDHKMNDVISNIIVGTRQAVVVLYAEDLVKVQPERKSCRASPRISLDVNRPTEPTEYECVIKQK